MFWVGTINSSFNSDLCKAFLSANIPLNKLSQPTFRKFREKYTNKSVPDQSTLRKTYVHECYEDTLCEIRTYASNKYINYYSILYILYG